MIKAADLKMTDIKSVYFSNKDGISLETGMKGIKYAIEERNCRTADRDRIG